MCAGSEVTSKKLLYKPKAALYMSQVRILSRGCLELPPRPQGIATTLSASLEVWWGPSFTISRIPGTMLPPGSL